MIVKSDDSPTDLEYILNKRFATEWKVPPHTRRVSDASTAATDVALLSISSAARRVNVSNRILSGEIFCDNRYETRKARVLVFPVPAPATIS